MIARTAAAFAAAALLAAAAPAAAEAAAMPGCAEPDAAGGEWRSYGADHANTRHQSAERVISAGDVPRLHTAWVFSSQANGGEGDFTGTPVVADGCVYVVSTRGWLFSINADTGALVWKVRIPRGGSANNSVLVAPRRLPAGKLPPLKRCKGKKGGKAKGGKARKRAGGRSGKGRRTGRGRAHRRCLEQRRRQKAKRRRARREAGTAGTVFVASTRTQKADGCPAGDPCIGPYMAAFDQATGAEVWTTASLDEQPGADVFGSPVAFDGVLMIGVSGGAAELGDEADRYAFQGSMVFLEADTGAVLRKTWTIHPPKAPDDEFAGAGVWSTPSIDPEAKVAYAGTANPFKPQAEHPHSNAVVKYDLDRSSPRFGEIVGSYKGLVDEYIPFLSQLPCYDIPGNPPPYYPQGIGSCGDIDLDFGASPHIFRDASGRKLVAAGQKSGVMHVFDAATMEPVWTQIVGPPGSLGGIVGSTAYDGSAFYGPITVPGYVWSISAEGGGHRWIGPIADGLHWGPPVASANGVIYSVDFNGFLDAFDARNGALLARRPLVLGGGGPLGLSWGGVSIARNTVYAAVGVVGLANGFVTALRPGTPGEVTADVGETDLGGDGGGGGGGGEPSPAGPSILAGPGAASIGYATPAMVAEAGGSLSFANLDLVQHDVISDADGPDGSPLFRTKLIGFLETAPVEGLDRVQAGQSYGFYCSIHPGMRGTLLVQ